MSVKATVNSIFIGFLENTLFQKQFYINQIEELKSKKTFEFVLDLNDFEENVKSLVIQNPLDRIFETEKLLEEKFQIMNVTVRIKQTDLIVSLRDLTCDKLFKLVTVRGIVNRTSLIRPMCKTGGFVCRECQQSVIMPQFHPSIIQYPTQKCPNCKCKVFDFDPSLSEFVDSQEINLQELPSDIPTGQTPASITVLILPKTLLNMVKCGDIIILTGVLKTVEISKRVKFTKNYIEALDIQKQTKGAESIKITSEDEKQIIELSKQPNLLSIFADNIAPSIYGLDVIKKACVLMLVGGVAKQKKNVNIRGEINCLIIGDPSVGKSQLLKAVSKCALHGIYASGRGISAAGLTVAVVRSEMTGEYMLEGGVLILADKGVACIDEIDKMESQDRIAIHEAMEQQTISVAKAGIVTTLNARAAVLACGNPSLGRYDTSKTPAQNLSNLPQTLFSRFDLIFLVLDVPDEEKDDAMARHILNISQNKTVDLSVEFMQKYIAYSKRINPQLTEEATNEILKYYNELRKTEDSALRIVPRHLESLIRLSEAHARLKLKNKVDLEDVKVAKEIFEESYNQVNYKPTSRQEIESYILGCLPMREEELIKAVANESGKDPDYVKKLVAKLLEHGAIYYREGDMLARV